MEAINTIKTASSMGRRAFLKMSAMVGAITATTTASAQVVKGATQEELKEAYPGSQKIKTICTSCSVGCGVIAEVHNGVWVRQEVAQDHPISLGGLCCKGASMIDMVRSTKRLKYPMVKEAGGEWKKISWNEAFDRIGKKLNELREKNGPESTMFLGSAKFSNELAYYFRKFAAFYGTNNIDHQARICHSSTVAGVANTFGYGAMTNHLGDIQKAKNIIIIGSNPAVNHPVGFQHLLKAKEKNNASIIVVDPRFTKSAAKADLYVRIRGGTDIAFMYGMLHIIFKNGWEDKNYIENRVYGMDEIRKEAERFTPEVVEDITGVPAEKLIQVTTLYASKRPGTLIWAMGLTQHTYGTSNTRIGPILQLALGNMGVEGGGTNILRGHDNVQGATDLGCVSDSLPGYYGLAEGSWKYFCGQWKVDYEWLKARHSADMMGKPGFTLARWYEGVLQEDKIHNAGTDIKALVVLGNGLLSTARAHKVVEALNKLELLVIADPFAHDAVAYVDSAKEMFLLPSASQLECSGSVTATNRSIQWRDQVVKPMYESKQDQEIMFELAKRLGFYNEYVKSMGDGNGNFKWPEDATREMARAIKTIGMTGHTPENLKAHQQNWHLFDPVTLAGFGPMKGKFYGLPWPCWTEDHCGSPVLYNNNIPVSQGGMGFRSNWLDKNAEGKVVHVTERGGVSLLAEKGAAHKGAKVDAGYDEVTFELLEKLGVAFTDEEKEKLKGKNWKNDNTYTLVKKGIAMGLAPFGNAKARAVAWDWVDQIPKHKEPLHTPRPDLVAVHPQFKDKPNHFRVDTRYESVQNAKDWSKEFPIILITGRLVTHNGQGVETRVSKYLAEIDGEMFANIHPHLAATLGIRNGDMIWVIGTEGAKAKVKARFSYSVDEKSVFLPFHFSGWNQGVDLEKKYPEGTAPYARGDCANFVTNYGYDIVTQIPETKTGLCKIEKA